MATVALADRHLSGPIRSDAPTVPADNSGVPLSEILASLSYALDLTEGAVPGHAIRCCLYGMAMAEALGLSSRQQSDLYYALLLKDVGCSSNAQRMCLLTGGDDVAIKHDVKFLDWTRPSLAAVTTLWRRAVPDGSALERVMRIVQLGLNQQTNNRMMIELRCDRGASIARKIGLNSDTAEAIRLLDEHWDGSGYPMQARGQAIPLLARIAAIAQHLDVFAAEKGLPIALDELDARSGRWFDPALVRLCFSLHRDGKLEAAVAMPDIHHHVMQLEPDRRAALPSERINQICEAFADIVDAKSSFTYRHSMGVTEAAVGIAQELGYTGERHQLIRRAALLHDLGKLSVPNTILDKPGKLTGDEWAVVRNHSEISRQILCRITPFAELASVAGQHHEKLDGSGYPFGLSARDLSLDARIITVADIYGALSEERPYRESLATEQVLAIMEKDVPHKLDADCFEALKRFLARNASAAPTA